jgi:hypothetical protein
MVDADCSFPYFFSEVMVLDVEMLVFLVALLLPLAIDS